MVLGQEDKAEKGDDRLCLELGHWKTKGTAPQSEDRFLHFGVMMRLTGAPARVISDPCLVSAAFPICRDDLGKEMRKMKKGLVFPFT